MSISVENDKLKVLADRHRLRIVLDESGERIIAGKRNTASHLFYYGNKSGATDPRTFGVMFMPDPHGKRPPAVSAWNRRRRALEAVGCLIVIDGDGEGCARFDPTNAHQVKVALSVAGVRQKRRFNPQAENPLNRLRRVRQAVAGSL